MHHNKFYAALKKIGGQTLVNNYRVNRKAKIARIEATFPTPKETKEKALPMIPTLGGTIYSETLSASFEFSKSPEGWVFWNKIYKLLTEQER